MQSVYLQRIMKKNADKGYEKTNPISEMAKMNANIFITKDYENEPPSGPEKTNPNKPNFRTLFPLTARPVRRKTLSSNAAGDYNEIFSQTSYFKTTPIERS